MSGVFFSNTQEDGNTTIQCLLCSKKLVDKTKRETTTIYKMKRHIFQGHFNSNRLVDYGDLKILPCKKVERPHYHCPMPKCTHLIGRIERFDAHIKTHKEEKEDSTCVQSCDSLPRRRKREAIALGNCELCYKSMRTDSFSRHKKEFHLKSIPLATLVDPLNHIYMVRKGSHGGISYQTHVTFSIICNENKCQMDMIVRLRSGVDTKTCEHG